MKGELPFEDLKAVASAVSIPVAVAGGINSETAADAIKAGAAIVIVGGAITKASDARKATETIKKVIETKTAVKTTLFKRADEKGYTITMDNKFTFDENKSFEDWVGLKEAIRNQTITITINYDHTN